MRLDHLLSNKKGIKQKTSQILLQLIGRCPLGERPNKKIERSQDKKSKLSLFSIAYRKKNGGIAQLARASALQAGCPGFESPCLQEDF